MIKLERYRTEKISIGWLQVKVKNGKIGTIQRGLAKGGLKQKSSELLHLNTCLVPLCIILSGLGRLSEEWIYVLSNSAACQWSRPRRQQLGIWLKCLATTLNWQRSVHPMLNVLAQALGPSTLGTHISSLCTCRPRCNGEPTDDQRPFPRHSSDPGLRKSNREFPPFHSSKICTADDVKLK